MSQEFIGQKLPHLTLLSSTGNKITLPEDLLGFWTVLFFYPMNETPGCTKEACSFRDTLSQFSERGAKVFGVSKDSIESHHKFISKHALNFPLLSDSDGQLAKALGVSSFLGMSSRDTFLINPEGKVAAVWRKVNATKTVEESYQKLKELSGAQQSP